MCSVCLPPPTNDIKPTAALCLVAKPEGKMKVRRTYKYRLYTSKRDKQLQQQIDVAGIIWNHALAVQRRTYRLTGKYINKYRLMSHLAKMRRSERFGYWQKVGSQAVQEIGMCQ